MGWEWERDDDDDMAPFLFITRYIIPQQQMALLKTIMPGLMREPVYFASLHS